ncbi:dienelactone hydrolase [Sphingomonas sp. Leaf17]|uniref:alpha/beta hydrolase n=1 Tax=Sphingomonas sp. Leaf17 TaxID=1735683 RepID=UPI0006F288FE|nr:alpha/beta hydrolase [Sphingomonas sp. Leaf17]KQM64960.1 dienelactone hydrolase [Sphingomonas sp. Leaf17]
MIDRRHALLGTLATALVAGGATAQTRPPGATGRLPDPVETIDLWPNGAPGAPPVPPVETITQRSTNPALSDRSVSGIATPRLVVFRPAVPNGSAALVMPGGGYVRIVIDKEGYEIARWLAARGWTVFVLFYRLPGDGWAAGPDVALSDAQRAMRLIRARAGIYDLRADRIAAMGFSAGGHVCGDLATRFDARTYAPVDAADRQSARPDAAAPIYAVQSMTLPLGHTGSRARLLGANRTPAQERAHSTALNVTATTPPCFLLHAEDDGTVDVGNTVAFRAALKAAGVPVETHLFAHGGHGFGLRGTVGKPVAAWPDLFLAWAKAQRLG